MNHGAIPYTDMHVIHAWSVANTTARDALTVAASDVGKICKVGSDPATFYLLSDNSPMSWVPVDASNATVGDNQITMAKLEDIAQYVIIGRNDSGTGDPEKLTRDEVASMLGGASGGTVNQGVHTIWIPATAMVSRTTNGAAAGSVESTTNKVMQKSLDFDAAADEFVQFAVRMPKSWDEGTITASFTWTANSTSTNSVVWGLQGVSIGNDETIDTAFGTAQTVTDANTATAYQAHTSAATSAITIGSSPAAEDWVIFQVYRDADNGSDTLAADAMLLGVTIYYTINASTDA